jgi:hypothetical protein
VRVLGEVRFGYREAHCTSYFMSSHGLKFLTKRYRVFVREWLTFFGSHEQLLGHRLIDECQRLTFLTRCKTL